MKKLSVSVLCLLSSILSPLLASAQTPQLINYQGRLLSGTNLVNGSVGLSLRLFDASTSGTMLYEDSNTVSVADGLYSTLIGDNTTFGTLTNALGSTNVWIEVAVNGTALSPRERLVSAAYAVKAQHAQIFTGSVLDSQLSANIARLNGTNQTFSGPVNFSSTSNTFTGTFSGNGGSLTNVDSVSLIVKQPPVIAWGAGTNDLNDGHNEGQCIVPASVTNVEAIACGGYHSLSLSSDGTVTAWGKNDYGQTIVPATATGVVAIAAGTLHSLALRYNGSVIAWGLNIYGQTNVPATATGVVAIACGFSYNLALRADGRVIAWGDNFYGQTNVPVSATGVVAIAGGERHGLALRGDGRIIAWGDNSFGQTNVPASATGVVAIAGGQYHSLALRADGTVIAWGFNFYGQTNVPASATGVVAIAAGSSHNLALRSDGVLLAWGAGTTMSSDPNYGQSIVPATATGVVDIAGGKFHSLALRVDRTAARIALQDRDNSFAGTVSAASFTGNGAGLTNIGSAALAPDIATNITARLASNVWAAADSTTNYVQRTGDTMSGALTIGSRTGVVDSQVVNLRVVGGNPPAWKGGAAFGHTNAAVIVGELVGVATVGGHNAALSAWNTLSLNPGGGNVGIGTLTPTSRLQVAGTVSATSFTGDGSGLTNIPANNLTGTIAVARLPATVPANDRVSFSFTQSNGNGFETSANQWTRIGTFVFRGTAAGGSPTNALALMYTVNAATYYRIRLYDAANATVIATSSTFNNGTLVTPGVVNLGALTNLPANQSVFEIQVLATDITGNAGVAGRQAIGTFSFQTF